MNCCDAAGHCTQGDGCPIRGAQRGQVPPKPMPAPAPSPMPIQYAEPEPDEGLGRFAWGLIATFAACVAVLFFIVWGMR